ncbi:hypothetical protein FM107_03690 [Sphingobacterium sp. JB170]|nr:hypothetical protein FM107_03690 [Sphingobacterium sp. JB170]
MRPWPIKILFPPVEPNEKSAYRIKLIKTAPEIASTVAKLLFS